MQYWPQSMAFINQFLINFNSQVDLVNNINSRDACFLAIPKNPDHQPPSISSSVEYPTNAKQEAPRVRYYCLCKFAFKMRSQLFFSKLIKITRYKYDFRLRQALSDYMRWNLVESSRLTNYNNKIRYILCQQATYGDDASFFVKGKQLKENWKQKFAIGKNGASRDIYIGLYRIWHTSYWKSTK